MKRYLPIFAISICLLISIVYGQLADGSEPLDAVRFWDEIQGKNLVPHYVEEEEKYYLFLPSYLEPEDVSVQYEGDTRVCLPEGNAVNSLGDLKGSQNTALQVSRANYSENYEFEVMSCGDLPTLFIEMQPGGLEWLNEDKKRQQSVFAQFVDEGGKVIYQNGATMNGRGNYSWREGSKRPYNLSFPVPVTMEPFGGMTTLCLMADYSDESRMRNALAYYAGQQMEIPYASAYMQVDVYVNGEYLGLYGVCTKQEYMQHIAQDGIQAVFELASNKSGDYFVTEESGRIVNVSYGNVGSIEKMVNRLEAALTRQDWETCAKLLDLRSFAEKYVLDEFMGNMDLGYASQYFYIGSDGRIQCMLPWDYDWSLGSAMTCFNSEYTYGLMTRRSEWYWGTKMLDCDAFRQEVLRVLEEDYTDAFIEQLQSYTLELEASMQDSRQCDAMRWRYRGSYGQGQSGYASLSDLTLFFTGNYPLRRDQLLRYFSAPEAFCLVEFGHHGSTYYFNYLIPKGDRLFDYVQDRDKLTGVREGYEIQGWYTTDGVPLEQLNVIMEDVVIYPDMVMLESYWGAAYADGRSLVEKLQEYSAEITVLGLFGLLAMMLFGVQVVHLLRKEWVNR